MFKSHHRAVYPVLSPCEFFDQSASRSSRQLFLWKKHLKTEATNIRQLSVGVALHEPIRRLRRTSDVGDGLWSTDLVFKQPLSLPESQVRFPAALHQRGLLQTAGPKTTNKKTKMISNFPSKKIKASTFPRKRKTLWSELLTFKKNS